MKRHKTLRQSLADRILLLDGALGTEIRKYHLPEEDVCEDMIALHRPEVLEEIHRAYLDAGADIISTNTFNAQRISLSDYALQGRVRDINLAAAQIARRVADSYSSEQRPRYVVGSVGPTTKSISLGISKGELEAAYLEQITALIEGGVDAILIETVVDPLNAVAAIAASESVMRATKRDVKIMVSATISDSKGILPLGDTIEAFYAAIASNHNLLSIGLNCSLGAKEMTAPLRRVNEVAHCYISAHPNAGLPNDIGEYDDTPEMMCAIMEGWVKEGLVNIIGGCCGTTPAHITTLRRMIDTSQDPIACTT